MGRLIDADELERYIDNCDFCDRCPDASPRCQIDCEMPDFLTKRWEGVIDAQPTVDAIPISWINDWYDRYNYAEVGDLLNDWASERKDDDRKID